MAVLKPNAFRIRKYLYSALSGQRCAYIYLRCRCEQRIGMRVGMIRSKEWVTGSKQTIQVVSGENSKSHFINSQEAVVVLIKSGPSQLRVFSGKRENSQSESWNNVEIMLRSAHGRGKLSECHFPRAICVHRSERFLIRHAAEVTLPRHHSLGLDIC